MPKPEHGFSGSDVRAIMAAAEGAAVISAAGVEDDAYGVGWNGDTVHAPSQNAIYDILATTIADLNGFPDALKNLTTTEIAELEAIGPTTISVVQWGYLGGATANGGALIGAADYAAMMMLLSGTAAAAFDFNSQNVTGGTYNGLTLAAAATGFTVAGGTTSKTLTLDDNFVVSTQLAAIVANTAKVTCNFTNVQTALAAASGAVDLNSQNLTGVGTIAGTDLTALGNIILGTSDGSKQIFFERHSADHPYAFLVAGSSDQNQAEGLRFVTRTTGGAQNYVCEMHGDGCVDILDHNGSTIGLRLGGTLVTVNAGELNYSSGVTSAIQTQLDARCLESVFGTSISTGLLLDGTALKASAVLQVYHGINPSADVQSLLACVDEAAIRTFLDLEAGTDFYSKSAENTWRNSVSQTEMGYLDGVTSAIQTQFTAKAALASPHFTGIPLAPNHGAAATDMLVNVCYGTGAAPTASTTTEGALYIKYVA